MSKFVFALAALALSQSLAAQTPEQIAAAALDGGRQTKTARRLAVSPTPVEA